MYIYIYVYTYIYTYTMEHLNGSGLISVKLHLRFYLKPGVISSRKKQPMVFQGFAYLFPNKNTNWSDKIIFPQI